MNFFEQPEPAKNQVPEGACPVCWGYQEYDHKIRKLFEDEQIDVIHHKKKYTLVRQFVKEHIEGIRLREGEIQVCPECGEQHNDKRLDKPKNRLI